MKREAGYYHVRLKTGISGDRVGPWTIGSWSVQRGTWNTVDNFGQFHDNDFAEIGPRIPTPGEAARPNRLLLALVAVMPQVQPCGSAMCGADGHRECPYGEALAAIKATPVNPVGSQPEGTVMATFHLKDGEIVVRGPDGQPDSSEGGKG